ncbi:hypothetical protein J6590_031034 [Homalodisca vitripennis]|nr:hypothetical protein J6590_031034 [Homalodisca vitripennis]
MKLRMQILTYQITTGDRSTEATDAYDVTRRRRGALHVAHVFIPAFPDNCTGAPHVYGMTGPGKAEYDPENFHDSQ